MQAGEKTDDGAGRWQMVRRGVALCAVVAVCGLTLAPAPLPSFLGDSLPSRLEHFVLFLLLSLACLWALPRKGVVLALILAALATEFAQGYVPKRSANLEDLVGNLVGIALGSWIVLRFVPQRLQVARGVSAPRTPMR